MGGTPQVVFVEREDREPALSAGSLPDILEPGGLRGRALKRIEDLLDALVCSYVALHLWYWGEEGYLTFGAVETGFILVPIRCCPGDP